MFVTGGLGPVEMHFTVLISGVFISLASRKGFAFQMNSSDGFGFKFKKTFSGFLKCHAHILHNPELGNNFPYAVEAYLVLLH